MKGSNNIFVSSEFRISPDFLAWSTKNVQSFCDLIAENSAMIILMWLGLMISYSSLIKDGFLSNRKVTEFGLLASVGKFC